MRWRNFRVFFEGTKISQLTFFSLKSLPAVNLSDALWSTNLMNTSWLHQSGLSNANQNEGKNNRVFWFRPFLPTAFSIRQISNSSSKRDFWVRKLTCVALEPESEEQKMAASQHDHSTSSTPNKSLIANESLSSTLYLFKKKKSKLPSAVLQALDETINWISRRHHLVAWFTS